MDDINEMWNQAPHDWSGLHRWLEQHKGKAEGISDNLVDMMSQITSHTNHPFPSSPQQLYEFFNQQIGQAS
jgi:hypothetical protein